MPRVSRKLSQTGIYHIMLRGINKQNIFEDNEDRFKFLEMLSYFKTQCKYVIYGYCIMNNHIHLLIKEREDSISIAIKRISSTYVLWYNKKYKRCGHLFQERFKSEPINDELSLLRVLRYIHQNPIKAGLVHHIFDTKWTSYYEYISIKNIIDTDLILDILSSNRDDAIELYMEYMEENNDDTYMDLNSKIFISDDDILVYLKLLGVPNVSTLQQMNIKDRNSIIQELKKMDSASIRQISRITGISKSVIGRL